LARKMMREDGRNKENPLRASNPRAFQARQLSDQLARQEPKFQQERLLLRPHQFLSLHLHLFNRNRTSLLKSHRINLQKRTSLQRKLRHRRRKRLRRISITFSS